jgi:hypothetical protein
MFNVWPAHICLWYLLFAAWAAWLAIKSRNSAFRRSALIGVGLAFIGILEFGFASLADAVETDRHLLLFHEFTDLTIWLSLTALVAWVTARINKYQGSLKSAVRYIKSRSTMPSPCL